MEPIARLARTVLVTSVLAAAAAPAAYAEHDHASMIVATADDPTAFTAGVSLVAANVETMFYTGEYQGVGVAGGWHAGRFAVGASLTGYRLVKNGKAVHGVGDVDVHGSATVLARGATRAGATLGLMAPTGDAQQGLGMGHVMAMSAAWVRYAPAKFSLGASAGYGRALGSGAESAHAQHGGGMEWPIVAPMYVSEVTLGAGGDMAVGGALRASARVSGALPTGQGELRLLGASGLAWAHGRVETGAEVQVALAGEPFGVRAVVETAVRF